MIITSDSLVSQEYKLLTEFPTEYSVKNKINA